MLMDAVDDYDEETIADLVLDKVPTPPLLTMLFLMVLKALTRLLLLLWRTSKLSGKSALLLLLWLMLLMDAIDWFELELAEEEVVDYK